VTFIEVLLVEIGAILLVVGFMDLISLLRRGRIYDHAE